jgi:hypothetical protein
MRSLISGTYIAGGEVLDGVNDRDRSKLADSLYHLYMRLNGFFFWRFLNLRFWFFDLSIFNIHTCHEE